MDIVKFDNQQNPLLMQRGQVINGFKTKTWIERYSAPDEFKLTAPLSVNMHETLPIGAMITHINSDSVMIVENHELVDDKTKPPEIVISGRGLDSITQWRVIPAVHHWNSWPDPAPNEFLTSDPYGAWTVANQKCPFIARFFMDDQVNSGPKTDLNDAYIGYPTNYFLPWTPAGQTYPMLETYVHTSSDWKDALSNFYKFLELDNFGMRLERPTRGNYAAYSPVTTHRYTVMLIHPGEDKSKSVVFSHDYGDIDSANYLWSDKSYVNTVFIRTSHKNYMLKDSTVTGLARRMIYIDFPEVDSQYDPQVSYPDATVMAGCRAKAIEVLNENRQTKKAAIEIARNLSRYTFRKDFKVGDLVTVDYGYLPAEVRRVSEYIEIEDERGEIGYPVLEDANDKVYGYG